VEAEPLPQPGDLSFVISGVGLPLRVIDTLAVVCGRLSRRCRPADD
jgi:hypothetical protein